MQGIQTIIASDIKGTINYFKTFGNVITIQYNHLKELCANTSANLGKILEGEYSLEIVRASSDLGYTFSVTKEYVSFSKTRLDTFKGSVIERVFKSNEDINGKKYYLVVLK